MKQNGNKQTKKIKQISVKNLFGMFNHVIPLHMDERITIIHGPNGFGKTAILRLLNDLFSSQNAAIRTIPFDEFTVDFDDGSSVWVSKTFERDREDKPTPQIIFNATNRPPKSQPFNLPVRDEDSSLQIMLEQSLAGADLVKPSRDDNEDDDIEDRKGEPDWIRQLRKSIPVRFIETQRLLTWMKSRESSRRNAITTWILHTRPQVSDKPTVTIYSEELAEIIKTKLAESTALSQSLDRTFPARVVNPTIRNQSITESELRNKLAELEKKRAGLIANGLLDQDNNGAVQLQVSDQIDESTKAVLSVYVEDVEKKLGIFDEIANKIALLKRIIDKRFLYKEMAISRRDGFVFTTPDGVVLPSKDLSSGEQHELILFYELLFKVAPGSLILIDEPEISLHVVWQEQFLKDVQEVTRLTDTDILMATHSPDIINGRRDLMVELEGPK